MKDQRLGKGLEKNRVLLYVSDENKEVLEELLHILDKKRFPSLGSAVFQALRGFIQTSKEEDSGLIPSGADIRMETVLMSLNRALVDTDYEGDMVELIKPVLIAHALVSLERAYQTYSMLGHRQVFPWHEVKTAIAEIREDVDLPRVNATLIALGKLLRETSTA